MASCSPGLRGSLTAASPSAQHPSTQLRDEPLNSAHSCPRGTKPKCPCTCHHPMLCLTFQVSAGALRESWVQAEPQLQGSLESAAFLLSSLCQESPVHRGGSVLPEPHCGICHFTSRCCLSLKWDNTQSMENVNSLGQGFMSDFCVSVPHP